MSDRMINRACSFWLCTLVAMALGTLSSCSWFPESTLILSPASRLPRWIELHGVTRSDVTVRVEFIVPLWGAYARISVLDRHGKVLERVDAAESSSVGVQTAEGAPSRGGFPAYQVAAFNGTKDIFEQREANNTLYMCDNATVWAKLAPGATMPPNYRIERTREASSAK